jgi:histone-lysine N-methyltransferase SETMAR
MEKYDQRGFIKTCVTLGQKPIEIHNKLVDAYGESAYSFSTVEKRVAFHRAGGESIKDAQRSGAPVTACNSANIKLVERLINENPRISYVILEELTKLSRGSLNHIITNKLDMKKKSNRWVPHYLSDQNKKKRLQFAKGMLEKLNDGTWRLDQILTGDEVIVYHKKMEKRAATATWKRRGEPPDTKVRRDHFSPKTMFSIWFKQSGPVLVHAVPKGRTIDNKYYIENCLGPAFEVVRESRPMSGLRGMKLLHDNARPHVHKNTRSFIDSSGILEIDHPPYSPDLAPCDFWLFDHIKTRLEDVNDAESLESLITDIVENIPRKEYIKTFQKYKQRLEYCVEAKGDYFEHLIK